MNILIVIARYTENIEWVRDIGLPYLILNVGDPITDSNISKNVINIPNSVRGRDASVHMRYIVDNYNNLPDKVVFLQADPFVHQPDTLKLLTYDTISKLSGCVGLTRYFCPGNPPDKCRSESGIYYIDDVECWKGHLDDHFSNIIPNFDENYLKPFVIPGFLNSIKNKHNFDEKDPVRKIIFDIYEIPYVKDSISPYFFACQFCVDKDRILKRPLSYYQRILSELDTTDYSAHMIERCWLGIFGEDANIQLKDMTLS